MRRLAPDPRRVDWFRVLADLQRIGVSNQQVALLLRIPRATLIGWKQGAEPKFADGEQLVILWTRMIGRPVETIPRQTNVFG